MSVDTGELRIWARSAASDYESSIYLRAAADQIDKDAKYKRALNNRVDNLDAILLERTSRIAELEVEKEQWRVDWITLNNWKDEHANPRLARLNELEKENAYLRGQVSAEVHAKLRDALKGVMQLAESGYSRILGHGKADRAKVSIDQARAALALAAQWANPKANT